MGRRKKSMNANDLSYANLVGTDDEQFQLNSTGTHKNDMVGIIH